MNIEQRTEGDVVVLTVAGNITMVAGGAPRLADKVRSVLQQGDRQMLLDLGRVGYMDSGGLGELVHAYSTVRKGGGALKLINVTMKLNDLLVMTKLLTVFECFDQEAEALASFKSPVVAS